jgi:uncharacterized membrane protein YphA (DoxX/SURF4 family)
MLVRSTSGIQQFGHGRCIIFTQQINDRKLKIMNIVLWIIQILLAMLFLFAGSMKFIMSAEQMNEGAPMPLPITFIHFIGICEMLGAIGLIVPWLTGIKRWLTPLAASLLIVIMIGAVVVSSMMAIAFAILPAVVAVLLFLVARGRYKQLGNYK